MPTHRQIAEIQDGSSPPVNAAVEYAADSELNLDAVVIPTANDTLVNWAALVAGIKSIFIYASGPLTIETNSSSAPDDVLTFPAAGVYRWPNGASEDALLLTADVTKLYVTNAGDPATLTIVCAYDATP